MSHDAQPSPVRSSSCSQATSSDLILFSLHCVGNGSYPSVSSSSRTLPCSFTLAPMSSHAFSRSFRVLSMTLHIASYWSHRNALSATRLQFPLVSFLITARSAKAALRFSCVWLVPVFMIASVEFLIRGVSSLRTFCAWVPVHSWRASVWHLFPISSVDSRSVSHQLVRG